jgi:peptidoglycan/LPS O-acetylase OafA/YrhL
MPVAVSEREHLAALAADRIDHDRFPGLEWLRFACALIVFINHYRFLAPDPEAFVTGHGHSLRALLILLLSATYHYGHLAVQVFWVISGFIFFFKYGRAIHDRQIGATRFFVWRFSRLYPLHFATLLTVALLQAVYTLEHGRPFIYSPNDLVHFLLQAAFASNWFTTAETFNGPIWSVSAEIVAYFVFFVVLRRYRPSARLCLAIVAAMFWFHAPVPTCLEFFFAGGFLQIATLRLDLVQRRVTFIAAALVVAEVATISVWWRPLNGASVLILALAIVAGFSVLDEILPLNRSIASAFGGMTYSLYLMTFPLLLTAALAADWAGLDRHAVQSFSALGAALILTMTVAYVVNRKFESPAQNAIRRAYRQMDSSNHRIFGSF